ncbi:MAG: hypothetical protein GY711_24770 [bacterium]|nr:hypothetical protein [bacterium]
MDRSEERAELSRRTLALDGADGLLQLWWRTTDPDERLELARAGFRAACRDDWPDKDLDGLAELGRAAIAEALGAGEAARTDDTRTDCVEAADVLSYNLAATLADCWPGDGLQHERRHFELGHELAEDCLKWRRTLKKGPFPFAVAHWARGIHALHLGRADAAVADMRAALEHAEAFAAEQERTGEPQHLIVAISIGYLGIALEQAGDPEGPARFDAAIDAFRAMARNIDTREDAESGVGQLQYVRQGLKAAR